MNARATNRSPLQRLVEANTGRDIEELLRELYLERRHSDAEIAKAAGVSRTVITKWRTEFGIARDERPPVVLA